MFAGTMTAAEHRPDVIQPALAATIVWLVDFGFCNISPEQQYKHASLAYAQHAPGTSSARAVPEAEVSFIGSAGTFYASHQDRIACRGSR